MEKDYIQPGYVVIAKMFDGATGRHLLLWGKGRRLLVKTTERNRGDEHQWIAHVVPEDSPHMPYICAHWERFDVVEKKPLPMQDGIFSLDEIELAEKLINC